MLTLSARKSARLSVGKLNTQAPQRIGVPEPAPVQSAPKTALDYLTQKNPALTALVESLDLIETSSTTIHQPRAVALPELPPVKAEPVDPKVEAIANRAFTPCRSYTMAEALATLATATGVSEERAAKGVAMMVSQGILSTAGNQCLYLSNSTPF